jgi:fructose-1,6-bisphosphatase I/sedoheptulose-1,7-bisphosphatase
MALTLGWTLTRCLIEERRRFPQASGDLNALLLEVAVACKAIARTVAFGELADAIGPLPAGADGKADSASQPLAGRCNEVFIRMNECNGHLAGLASELLPAPRQIPKPSLRGKYLLLFDPLDGASSIELNLSVGSLFSILRAPPEVVASGRDVNEADFLQPGATQVAAGYAIYGPSTMLVLSVGNGVAGFRLSPTLGEFVLTHPSIRVPEDTQEFAINSSKSRFWEPPIKRYVDECLAGKSGPRGKDFNTRWIASLVAEAHRILMQGGVFLDPRDLKDPAEPGQLRLLFEVNPLGFVLEQAGGRASTGRQSALEVKPSSLHQRIGFVFGSKNEVDRIERYHHEPAARDLELPLFAARSLFRD